MAICIERYKLSSGVICAYLIQSGDTVKEIQADQLKSKLAKNPNAVTNLKLTSNNKIVPSGEIKTTLRDKTYSDIETLNFCVRYTRGVRHQLYSKNSEATVMTIFIGKALELGIEPKTIYNYIVDKANKIQKNDPMNCARYAAQSNYLSKMNGGGYTIKPIGIAVILIFNNDVYIDDSGMGYTGWVRPAYEYKEVMDNLQSLLQV